MTGGPEVLGIPDCKTVPEKNTMKRIAEEKDSNEVLWWENIEQGGCMGENGIILSRPNSGTSHLGWQGRHSS